MLWSRQVVLFAAVAISTLNAEGHFGLNHLAGSSSTWLAILYVMEWHQKEILKVMSLSKCTFFCITPSDADLAKVHSQIASGRLYPCEHISLVVQYIIQSKKCSDTFVPKTALYLKQLTEKLAT